MKPASSLSVADAAAPVAGHGVIARPRLLRRLGAARVTQISAPAGSGKTVLLRSWLADPGVAGSAARVRVAGRDPDPRRFWVPVLGALRDTLAGSRLAPELTATPDLDGWTLAGQLLTDLGGLTEPLWLVIDDVHELCSDEVLSQLERLITGAPPELRFVLAARHDLRLGLHRLRLDGELAEIRPADLRFTDGEARALLRAGGVTVTDSAVELLLTRTEGWAAGLRLAALSLSGHPAPERFAAEFSGTERTVAEYLRAEVLQRQSEEARRLLLRTSVAEQVSGPLADLLTDGHGSERVLQDLEDAGAFVFSLDAGRSRFRCHRLFADLLRRELRRTEPDLLPRLHGTAARWYAEHGSPVEAVRQAQQALDWSLASRLLCDSFLGLMLDGQGRTVHELLAGFPSGAIAADAELSVAMGADEQFCGTLEAAECYLARAARALASMPPDRVTRVRSDLGVLRLSLAQRRGDLPAAAEQATRLLAPARSAPPADTAGSAVTDEHRALALLIGGAAELWALRVEEAERHLARGVALARGTGRPWLQVYGLAHAARAASFRSFARAEDRCTRAIGLAREHGWTREPVVAVAYAVLAAMRVWQMRLDDAEDLLEDTERALRAELDPAAGLLFHQARGLLQLARGRDADALAAFRDAEKLAGLLVTAHPGGTPARAGLMQALIRLGESADAEAVFIRAGETARGEMRNALAALRLAQHDPGAAADALAPVLDGTAPVAGRCRQAEALVLEAITRDTLEDSEAARVALEHALDLAEPDGALLPFLLHPAGDLLRRHVRRGTAHAALVTAILDVLARKARVPAGVPAPLTADRIHGRLSDSETRLLRYLPTNLTAPEIAAEMTLSVNTIRTHTRHLYEKLSAHSRTQAVERARALGLLAPSGR